MPFLEMLTINEGEKRHEEIMEIVWRALKYFPKGLWEEVNYLGNANIKHDVKIKIRESIYGAFIFNNLIGKIKRIRSALGIKNLLLAVTSDPIIAVYHRFDARRLSQVANLIYDYVSWDTGVVSLFRIEDERASKIIAHGLGHNRGLRHHAEPIDIMYEGLLEYKSIRKDGFCNDCIKKILV
ncbi:hypothetical protein KEJ14_06760 [Candidatus Bathyarchaeota archaeon]|nr:hypothetical protein [Candidatus Bathyarchaeota archaeon]